MEYVTVMEWLDMIEESVIVGNVKDLGAPITMADIGAIHMRLLVASNRLLPRVVDCPEWMKRKAQEIN